MWLGEDGKGYNFRLSGLVAQLVEQRTENPCVGGSIPPQATNSTKRNNSAARAAPSLELLPLLVVGGGPRGRPRFPPRRPGPCRRGGEDVARGCSPCAR